MSVNVPPRSIQNCQRELVDWVMMTLAAQPHYIGAACARRAPGDVVQMRRSSVAIRKAPSLPEPQEISMNTIRVLVAALAPLLSLNAAAQTKWDLPTAYPTTNSHTENITQFVA